MKLKKKINKKRFKKTKQIAIKKLNLIKNK
jgi:hypothetical protein